HYLLRSDYQVVKKNGLHVYSVEGDFFLENVQGYLTSEEIGEVDLVLVGLKTFANHRYNELIKPLLHEQTIILTLQNGLGNEEALAECFGPDRVLGGVAFLCSNRGEPGVIHHLGEGCIILGEYNSPETNRVEKIAKLFRESGVPCRAVADLKKARWEKLIWNIPFNGICALMLCPVDTLLRHPGSRGLVIDIMSEVIEAANAQGISEKIKHSLADDMVKFTEGLGSYKPSMLIDRQESRPLELQAIFQFPLTAAIRKGIRMPKVEELYNLLDLSENGFTV
ncbi:MAG: 2-dehydropantoate 2-reductase, partial [Deltaproteobacteria bacterium]